MNEEINEIKSVLTKEDAFSQIGMIRQQIALLGRNDSEFSRIDEIINSMNIGKITTNIAVDEANKVLNEKQEH